MRIRSFERAKQWAHAIKQDIYAVWLAARDTRTPLVAKVLAFAVAAYAISPIDLIPDFIPVLGYLDDLIIVPLGIVLIVRLIPLALMAELRVAASKEAKRPVSLIGAVLIIITWVVCLVLVAKYFYG